MFPLIIRAELSPIGDALPWHSALDGDLEGLVITPSCPIAANQ